MRRILIWIAALLALGVIGWIGWGAYERNKASDAAENIKEHWDRVNAKARLENEELLVKNDQLDIDITRQQGKRPSRDQLKKLELDEATVESEKMLIRAQEMADRYKRP
jgi:predicted negative regulator of RcsB-dependent stress response